MPSAEHEAIVELIRNHPPLALYFLRDRLGVDLPAYAHIAVSDVILGQLAPTELRADLVLVLRDAPGGPSRLVIVVEVQLGIDADKPFVWPSYLVNAFARERCAALVLVITACPKVATWARRSICVGPGNEDLKVHVLGPSEIPLIEDPAQAIENPALTLLSLLARGPASKLAVVLAALERLDQVDSRDRNVYTHLVFRAIGAQLQRAVEAHYTMLRDYPEFKDPPPALKPLFDLIDRSKAEGKAEGEADAVLQILALRKVHLEGEQQAHIAACRDLVQLRVWLERALTATTAAELFH